MNDLGKLAYRVVREKKKPYPKSWNKNQQTESTWLKKFEDRHSNKIINLFSPDCKAGFIQTLTNKQQFPFKEILIFQEEQGLLTYIKIVKKGYICRNCVMIKMTVEVYKILLI